MLQHGNQIPDSQSHLMRSDCEEGLAEEMCDDLDRDTNLIFASAGDASLAAKKADELLLKNIPELHTFKLALTVAGLLHIGHNALEHACLAFPWWASFEVTIGVISRIFARPSSRDRFVATCGRMLNASERRLFKALAPEFLSWRRSSLLHVAQWSSRRRSAIRKAWSAKAFKTGGQQTDGGANGVINHDGGDDLEAQETGVDKDLKQLDAIIRDPVTWARLEALAQLALIPESLTQWGSGLPMPSWP